MGERAVETAAATAVGWAVEDSAASAEARAVGERGRAEAGTAGGLAGAAAGGRVGVVETEAGGVAMAGAMVVEVLRRSQRTAPDNGLFRESSRLA